MEQARAPLPNTVVRVSSAAFNHKRITKTTYSTDLLGTFTCDHEMAWNIHLQQIRVGLGAHAHSHMHAKEVFDKVVDRCSTSVASNLA
eukprot:1194120-Prorocentrum_minimum.AAC.7